MRSIEIHSVCHGEPHHHVGSEHEQEYAKKNEVIQSTAFRFDFLFFLAFRFIFVEVSLAWLTSVTGMTLCLFSSNWFFHIETDSIFIGIHLSWIFFDIFRILSDGVLFGFDVSNCSISSTTRREQNLT